jgi:hypothetical protein
MKAAPIVACLALAALAACNRTQTSVANSFNETSAAIAADANAMSAETENATRNIEAALDNQGAALSNGLDEAGNRMDAAANALAGQDGNRQ